jgi:hypothetical protein
LQFEIKMMDNACHGLPYEKFYSFCYATFMMSKIMIWFFSFHKDHKTWEPKRIGALILYIFVAIISYKGIYVAIRAPYKNRQRKELTEAYMEALIPEPSPSNIRK